MQPKNPHTRYVLALTRNDQLDKSRAEKFQGIMTSDKEQTEKLGTELLGHLRDPFNYPPRDPVRIDRILNKFRDLWLQGTDMRFCQLIHCIVDPRCNCQLFNTEDCEFEGRLDAFIKRSAKETDVTRNRDE